MAITDHAIHHRLNTRRPYGAEILDDYMLELRTVCSFSCRPEDYEVAVKQAEAGLNRLLYEDLCPIVRRLRDSLYDHDYIGACAAVMDLSNLVEDGSL